MGYWIDTDMGVSTNGDTSKLSIFMVFFPYKLSILGYPHDYGKPQIPIFHASRCRWREPKSWNPAGAIALSQAGPYFDLVIR